MRRLCDRQKRTHPWTDESSSLTRLASVECAVKGSSPTPTVTFLKVSWNDSQRDSMQNIWYIKWCNIEHSVRWTYSRRTVISIIQGNVITNLTIQCCAAVQFCHKQRSSRVCFYWYSHFCPGQGFQQVCTADLPNTITAVPPRRSWSHRGPG